MGPHVTERLSAYMDGELPAEERALVDAHLRACPPCSTHLQELRAVEAAARALPPEVPDGYFEAFPGRVRERLTAGRRRRRLFVPAWTFAAAAAVVLAVITPRLLREPPSTPGPRSAAPASPAPAMAGAPTVQSPPPAVKDSDAAKTDSAVRRSEAPPLEARAPAQVPPAAPAPARKLAERVRPQPQANPGAAAGALAREKTETDQLRDLGYAAAPRADGFEPAPQTYAEAENAPAREAQKSREDKTTRAIGVTRERSTDAADPEARFQLLAKRKGGTAEEARALRDAWRAYVRDEPAGPRADEARVRAVEAGAAAWRQGRDEKDRVEAEREAREYLARKDALQPDRVRAALQTLAR